MEEQYEIPHPVDGKFIIYAGGLAEFDRSLSAQTRRDLLNGLLYAQMSADQNSEHDDNPVDWYNTYVIFLRKIGFEIEDITFQKATTHFDRVVLGDVVIHNLADMNNPKAVAAIKASINILRSLLATDEKLKVFYSKSRDTTAEGGFQLNYLNRCYSI